MAAPNRPELLLDVQWCPKCASTAAKAATLTMRFVYQRCPNCGEIWVIPERRWTRRDNEDVEAARLAGMQQRRGPTDPEST